MGDERVEDEMIEIGDPSEEMTAVEPPPRLVIEYRERGVPWMLIPPMIVLSAVAAVLVYVKLTPPSRPVAVAAPSPSNADDPPIATEAIGGPSATRPEATNENQPEVESDIAPPSPFELAIEKPSTPAPATEDVASSGVVSQGPPEPVPFPRVQGLGFDPKGLVDPEPPVDQAVAPAAGPQDRGDQPAREALPAVDPIGRDQPEEVDPNVLPVDPREAKRRREQRLVEAKRKAEADRGQFHAELRAICRKSGERAGPEIDELCKKYGMDIDPAIQARATRLLNGAAAGVDRPVRINLLRSLGFSEALILKDIAGIIGTHQDGTARGGARSSGEITYQSALLLLGYPPTRVATPSKPLATSRAAR